MTRIYIFPLKVIVMTLPTDFPYLPGDMPVDRGYHPAATACRLMLVILFCMHCVWFYMLVRIAVRLVTEKEDSEKIGDDEYEGGSSADSD